MATKTKTTRTRTAKPKTMTVLLRTGINGNELMQKQTDAGWVDVFSATNGDVVKMNAATANRMIDGGVAEKVN